MPSLRLLEAELTKYSERQPTADERALNPHFPASWRIQGYGQVATLAEAHGVWFLCPLCFQRNKGSVGTHSVMAGFAGRCPPGSYTQNKSGQDSRWVASGTGLDDLILSPSIQLEGGCNWHGFVGMSGVPPGHAA